MLEKLKNAFKKLSDFWSALERSKKTRLVIFFLLIVIGLFSSITILNTKTYVILYDNLESSEAGEIFQKLKEMNVDCKTSGTGTILVEENLESEVRMQLASEGYPQSGLNYDLYINSITFGTTDKEKAKYMIFQLQDRLQITIKTLSSVKNAIVTISIPEENVFVFENERVNISASIVLELKSGVELTDKQVKGIEQLVAKSVSGLETDNIAIIDTKLNILNIKSDGNNISDSRLNAEEELRNQLENRILLILEPVFGYQKVRVGVSVKLDFDKNQTESVVYTPVIDDEGIVSTINEQKENVSESSQSLNQLDADSSVNSSSSSDTISNITDYEVNQTKQIIEKAQGEISDLTIAVVINSASLNDEKINQVKKIVAYSAGIMEDKVSVSYMEFTGQEEMLQKIEEAMEYEVKKFPIELSDNLILGLVSIILTFILIIMVMKSFKNSGLVSKKGGHKISEENISTAEKNQKEAMRVIESLEKIQGNNSSENQLKKEINDYIGKSSEDVAQLVKNWIGKEN